MSAMTKLVLQMKSLLGSLDSHLGQKGKTFLSGDKVFIIKIIKIIKFIIKIMKNADIKVGMPDLMLWPWFERLGCLDFKHPGMKVNGDDDLVMMMM